MGLDKPLPVQYVTYLGHLVQGDLGMSQQTRTPVAAELRRAFPATAELATMAIVFSVLIGTGLGLWAALRRGRAADQVIRIVSLIGISAPTFWLALIAYYVFFFQLKLLPGSGRLSPTAVPPPHISGFYTIDSLVAGQWGTFADALGHLMMPSLVLALGTVGLLTRFSRSSVLEVLNMDYVRAARAKGLPTRTVVFRYILRGALMPIITVVGIAFGSLLSGAVLTEKVFSWHGIGEYAFNGATKLDLPAVMGVGLVVGITYIVVNLVVDLIYGFVDPRVRNA
jgi:peptide/nickel transport system permease protein